MLIIAIIFLMVTSYPAGAAELEIDSPLTLDNCIQQALQNNPASSAAKFAEQSALEDVGAAKGRYYPEIGVRTAYRRWETHVFLPQGVVGQGIPPTVGPINEWRANLRGQYTLFDSGLRSSELASAQSQHSAAKEESARTRNEIVFGVHSAYYEYLAAEDELQLSKSRQLRSKDHLRIASDRKEAGDVPQADVTRARVDVASADLAIVSAESALRIARGRLNESMGRSAHEPLQIVRNEIALPDPTLVNVQESITDALQKRPEVQAALRRVDAKKSQIGATRSEILPKVRAEAGYGWLDEEFLPGDSDWWVGLTLDIPLFDGGTRQHRIAKSKVEVNREQAQLDQLKLAIQQEVWTAYSRWIESYQSLQTSFARKEEADESLQLTRARYEEGASTINDLLDAELALAQAETSISAARFNLFVAKAAFQLATGEL